MDENFTDYPRVSVIIPVYNGESFIKECIEHLLQQNYPKEKLEIIIVDDGSNDRTIDIVNEYELVLIHSLNKGPATARNEGIKHSTGSILIFIDSDCLADENLVLNHVLAHRYYETVEPNVAAVGGSIEGYNKNIWSICDDFCSWYNNHPGLPSSIVQAHPTANISISRKLSDLIKFDEELRYAEDYAFCVEIVRRGYKIAFEPKAKIRHINRTSFYSFMNHAKNWSSSQQQLLKKGVITPKYHYRYLGISPYVLYCTFAKVIEMIYYSFKAKRFHIILFLPFIIINKLYLNYLTFKLHWAFFDNDKNTPR